MNNKILYKLNIENMLAKSKANRTNNTIEVINVNKLT